MRYYEIYLPGEAEPVITTNLRRVKGLPDGTKVLATVTERDGSLADQWEIPVVDGRAQLKRSESVYKPEYVNL